MNKLSSERKFQQIAVGEMLNSRSEHTNKFDPMVGAVLVDRNGKLIAQAHRGTFFAGDHAEFTILEKLVPGIDPSGCTLYTTLEPCTSRRPPKVSCARRIVDKHIGRVVIGITDPNPEIHGQGIQLLVNNGVKVEFFDNDLVEKIVDTNRQFIKHYECVSRGLRIDVSQQITDNKSLPTVETPDTPSYVEYQPVPHAGIEDLSEEAIKEFLPYLKKRTGKDLKLGSAEVWRVFKKLRLLVESTNDGELVPTICGMVLFGESPDLLMPHCKVKVLWYAREAGKGHLINDLRFPARDFCGPLLGVVDETVGFLKENLDKVPRIEETRRINAIEYPEAVLREVIVNALVHRDYGLTFMHVLIEVFPDRIQVKSPGVLVRPITLDTIKQFKNVGSIHRNPRIVDTMYHLHRMEESGLGIPTLPILLKEYGLNPPSFELYGGYFVVTLYGRAYSQMAMLIPEEIRNALNTRQISVLEFIKKNGRITSEICTAEFAITRETANQDFKVLMTYDLIKKIGSGRGTYYALK